MASPPKLDFEALFAPIEGDDPAGVPMPFLLRKQLDDARKEINPDRFAENDPRRPEQPQPADWPTIEKLTCDALAQSSKDLQVAARLTEALVKQYGFAGLRDGLRLLRRLSEECWDRMHPVIKTDDDLDARAGPFDWLDDPERGARFPNSVRAVPLTRTADQRNYGWQQWDELQKQRGTLTAAAFEQAVAATPRAYCQAVVDDIAESAGELEALATVLNAKMGELAPGLGHLRKSVVECQELATQILQRKGHEPDPVPEAAATAAAHPASPLAAPPRALTRDDVLARLADASALLLQMEPQSPIAYLVQRAVKLARLPLPELMRVLVRDKNVLGELDRDLDLGLDKKDEAAKAAKK